MHPQEYTISQFNAGDFKDQNNNVWCNVLFVEKSNEPLRWVVKDPTAYSVGMKVYGHIETKTSQAGKPYERFYRDQKPDVNQQTFGGSNSPKSAYKDNSDGQRQGMCFNNAANFVNSTIAKGSMTAEQWAEVVHRYANALYRLGDLGTGSNAVNSQNFGEAVDDFDKDFNRGLEADGISPDELNNIFPE